jgi:hypothetical protein
MRFIALLAVICLSLLNQTAEAAQFKIIKVLPHRLDHKGRQALAPSLYERDAYQAWLRSHPSEISAIKFNVQWKGKPADLSKLKIRLELRGTRGTDIHTQTLEQPVTKTGFLTTWTSIKLEGEDFKNFGDLIAWRATLWDDGKQVAEQKSFLW